MCYGLQRIMLVLWSLAVSGAAYYYLQSLEDARAARQRSIPASTPRRVMLWFFLWMVCLVLLYLIGIGASDSGVGKIFGGDGSVAAKGSGMSAGGKMPDPMDMLRRIPEEVDVGLPPF